MTTEVADGRIVSVATCACKQVFKFGSNDYLRMNAAIEAHWQKFDHLADKIDGMGHRIGSEAAPVPKPKRPRKRTKSDAPEGIPASNVANAGPQAASRSEPAPSLPPDGAGSADSKCDRCEPAQICAGATEVSEPLNEGAAAPGTGIDPAREAGLRGGSLALVDDDGALLRAAEALAWREPPKVSPSLAALLNFNKVYAIGAEVTRPLLRWHGGKWKLAPWIMGFFPEHRIYVEPFGGAGSVLMRKPRVYAEVYNDLDDVVTNLFRVLRDDAKAARLIEALRLTPFSRAEFNEALHEPEDDVERARHLIVRSYMGFGSNAHSASATAAKTGFKSFTRPDDYRSTGFRANSNRSGTTPAHDWANYPDALPAIVERLRGVIVEQRPAMDVMRQHDGEGTLHYVDPPYLPETRSPANKYDLKHRMYRHELSADDHLELLAFLRTLQGHVILSGYPSEMYDEALPDWRRETCAALADGARERTEVVWINPACAAAIDQQHPTLFNIPALDVANTPPPLGCSGD
jgi:DNA adenine methylase